MSRKCDLPWWLRRFARKDKNGFSPATNQHDGQITKSLSISSRKNISVFQKCKSPYMTGHPVPFTRGVSRSSRTWGGVRWTLSAATDARGSSVRRNRVVLAPEAGAKLCGDVLCEVTVATELGSPGRSRISRKTIAQGKPDALRWTCMLVCALLVQFAHGTAGAARTRLSLRPCFRKGESGLAKLGRNAPRDRERMSRVRHCEKRSDEAIQLSLLAKVGLLRRKCSSQ